MVRTRGEYFQREKTEEGFTGPTSSYFLFKKHKIKRLIKVALPAFRNLFIPPFEPQGQ